LEAVATVTPPEYQHLLELDARVRDFHPPAALTDSNATARFLVMQRAIVASGRDIGTFVPKSECYTIQRSFGGQQSCSCTDGVSPKR
jgi:hypothetical protein